MPKPIGGDAVRKAKGADHASAAELRLELKGRINLGLRETSDVVALPGGRLLAVSDVRSDVAIVERNGEVRKVSLPGLSDKDSQLEAVAYDPVRSRLFVVREEARELLRYDFDPANGMPVLEAKVDLPLGKGNKGVEGLTYLPAEHSPTRRPQLLAAVEGKPASLFLLDEDGGGRPRPIELPARFKDVCRDFSGLALDPRSGAIWLCSDESASVAKLELVDDQGKLSVRLLETTKLRDERGKSVSRLEGVAIGSGGELYALLENDAALLRYERR